MQEVFAKSVFFSSFFIDYAMSSIRLRAHKKENAWPRRNIRVGTENFLRGHVKMKVGLGNHGSCPRPT